ncbi:MAG: DNA gyrase inhibitor YacG [Aquabacterium sp.]
MASQTPPPSNAAAPRNADKPLKVRCPSCGEMHLYSTDNPYRPFCSKGCKAIDLGAWASEQYRVEAKPATEDLLDDPGA